MRTKISAWWMTLLVLCRIACHGGPRRATAVHVYSSTVHAAACAAELFVQGLCLLVHGARRCVCCRVHFTDAGTGTGDSVASQEFVEHLAPGARVLVLATLSMKSYRAWRSKRLVS